MITDNSLVRIIDLKENEWLLRTFMAKIVLPWFQSDEFFVMHMKYTEDTSKCV
jgi:hypothetical protein